MSLELQVLSHTTPTTLGGTDGSITVGVVAPVSGNTYKFDIQKPSGWVYGASHSSLTTHTFEGLPAGSYNMQVSTFTGTTSPLLQFVLPEPAGPEYPDIRVTAAFPHPVVVAGNPVAVTLQSVATGQAPTKAEALITLSALVAGTVVTINDIKFRYALVPGVNEFNDAETLAQALLDTDLIDRYYTISQPTDTTVKLVAIQTGSAYTPTFSSSTASVTATITGGVDEFIAQVRKDWGCYVEVWACNGVYGDEVSKDGAVLQERIEKLYAPGNSYTFDISTILQRYLRHALLTETDRLQAYFVRFGEVYYPANYNVRRRYPMGESAVLWALEGSLPFTEVNSITGTKLLSKLPATVTTPLHGAFHSEAFYVLAATGITLALSCRLKYYDGLFLDADLTIGTSAGGVVKLPWASMYTLAMAQAKKVVSCELKLHATLGEATTLLTSKTIRFMDMHPRHACVVFASSLGAYESAWFTGVPESSQKRDVDSFSRGIGAVTSPSGRATAVRAVELAKTQRLHSTALDREAFEWMREELAVSPDVFLFNPASGTYAAVTVTGMEEKADFVEEEYYISISLEPSVPHNTLRN